MHGSGFREAARENMRKIIKTMAVTEEQLKVVFEIGAASEGTNLDEVKFSQKGTDLFVYEKFREDNQSTPFQEFWFKATLISSHGVRTIDIERSPKHWLPEPW